MRSDRIEVVIRVVITESDDSSPTPGHTMSENSHFRDRYYCIKVYQKAFSLILLFSSTRYDMNNIKRKTIGGV